MHNQKFIGLLGGTFDPIHNGHLYLATQILNAAKLDEIKLIPCYEAVHRDPPFFSPEDRLRFVKIAIESQKHLSCDDIEITRGGPSYTIDTIRSIKAHSLETTFYFILGLDAFDSFPSWHDHLEILSLCNLIVVNRPGSDTQLSKDSAKLLKQCCKPLQEIHHHKTNAIFTLDIDALNIAATTIRQQFIAGNISAKDLPIEVYHTIRNEGLYEKH